MSVQIVSNEYNAALFCSTTMHAFGPVFSPNEQYGLDAGEMASVWLAFLWPTDARTLTEQAEEIRLQKFYAWLDEQTDWDVDDLCRMAKTGEIRCRDCGDWTQPEDTRKLTCESCHEEFLRDQEAERKGDAMREESV